MTDAELHLLSENSKTINSLGIGVPSRYEQECSKHALKLLDHKTVETLSLSSALQLLQLYDFLYQVKGKLHLPDFCVQAFTEELLATRPSLLINSVFIRILRYLDRSTDYPINACTWQHLVATNLRAKFKKKGRPSKTLFEK